MSGGLDRERLTKLMRMTESSADGEALNALRLANKLLREAGLHWGDILKAGPDRSHLVPPSKRNRGFNPKPSGAAYGRRAESQKYDGSRGRNTGDDIDMMLEALSRRRNSIDFQMFLGSVAQFWEKNGYLTDNQYAAIVRSYGSTR